MNTPMGKPFTCPECGTANYVAVPAAFWDGPTLKPACDECGALLQRTLLPEVEVPPELRRFVNPRWRFMGECYLRALEYAARHDVPGMRLLHGSARIPRGPAKGRLMPHAWVELPGEGVIFNGHEQMHFDAAEYRAALRVEADASYGRSEACALAVRTGTYGPWPGEPAPSQEELPGAPEKLLELLRARRVRLVEPPKPRGDAAFWRSLGVSPW